MGQRKDSIEAILKRSETDLNKIAAEYNQSLRKQTISADMKIDIKNFCGNLRSVLDYLAHEIREKYPSTQTGKDRFYFPIISKPQDFSRVMKDWYPQLEIDCPDLWQFLEERQPYKLNNQWLGNFNDINNDNKHEDLVEQKRTEIERIHVKTLNSGQVSWDPQAVKFGSGVYIGGVPVNPSTQLPIPHPSQTVEKIVWVDFKFSGINVSAIQLLEETLNGIKSIVSQIYKWL